MGQTSSVVEGSRFEEGESSTGLDKVSMSFSAVCGAIKESDVILDCTCGGGEAKLGD